MTVSGFEHRYKDELLTLLSEYGDATTDKGGNYVVYKRSAKANAPLLVIDAHIDEIGMIVTKIHDGGFLSVTSIGGLDPHILQSAEVEIFGKKTIYGVITSTPPHLRAGKDNDKILKVEEVYIDTGLSRDTLEKLVPIGTPIKFRDGFCELANDVVCSRSLDNKICCACALEAIAALSPEQMEFDVAVLLSLREESGGYVGARVGMNNITPALVISLDVNFAQAPDTSEAECAKRGEGFTVSLSAVTDRRLTKRIIGIAKYSRLPYRVIAEPNNVGMNANAIGICNAGVACADLGIPIGSMHTCAETASLRDCDSLIKLLCAVICDKAMSEDYAK